MALNQELLAEALVAALKVSELPCGVVCRAGAELDGDNYRIWHNGAGSLHTNAQQVYASKVLSMSREQMTGHLRIWLESLHKGEPTDLNASG